MKAIRTVTLPLPFRMGAVNCYLVATGSGFVLIDTGAPNKREELESELVSASCKPGTLDLIILTHGDFDHTGNAAYLRDRFGTKLAMHKDDSGMAEYGDMFWNRASGNAFLRKIVPIFLGFSESNRFVPDLYVDDGYDLSEFGFEAKVLSLPGHSRGSVGVLTVAGDLFCGDLFENTDGPSAGSIVDDPAACKASIERLQGFEIKTAYPGHGSPFPWDAFVATYQERGRDVGGAR
jgi:glyoxylase-like metal-dependent hydrolase (beta-lactamase superfamily II)